MHANESTSHSNHSSDNPTGTPNPWIKAADTAAWSHIAELVDSEFFAALLQDPKAVEYALELAPERWLVQNPRYLNARELIRARRKPFAAVNDRVSKVFRDWVDGQSTPMARDLLGVQSARIQDLLMFGRLEGASRESDRIWEIIESSRDSEGFPDVLPPLFILGGTAKLLAGARMEALTFFQEARRWSRGWGEHPVDEYISNYLALAYAMNLDYRRASEHIAPWAGDPQFAAGTYADSFARAGLLARALLDIGAMDGDSASHSLKHLQERFGGTAFWWVAVHAQALHSLYWGNAREGAENLEHQISSQRVLTNPASFAGQQLLADLANLYQAAGDLEASRQVLSTPKLDLQSAPILAPLMRLELQRGDAAAALRHMHTTLRARGPRAPSDPSWEVLRLTCEFPPESDVPAGRIREVAQVIRGAKAVTALMEAPWPLRRRLIQASGLAAEERTLYPPPPPARLTRREREVLEALRLHATAPQIAAALHISPNTAKTHLASVYKKLGVHSRDAALLVAAHF